ERRSLREPQRQRVDEPAVHRVDDQAQAVEAGRPGPEQRHHERPRRPRERLIVPHEGGRERPRQDFLIPQVRVVDEDARIVPADESVVEHRPERGERGEREHSGVDERRGTTRRRAAQFRHGRSLLSLTGLHHLCRKCVRGYMTPAMQRTIVTRGVALSVVALCLAIVCAPAYGQTRGAPPPGAAAASDEGIPVDNALVKARCGSCHRSDDKGRMSRISFRRASPENWELTIKRMVALNHVTLSPDDARNILKYLTDHQGLAPEELRPIVFEGEHRMVEFSYTADETTA